MLSSVLVLVFVVLSQAGWPDVWHGTQRPLCKQQACALNEPCASNRILEPNGPHTGIWYGARQVLESYSLQQPLLLQREDQ